MAIVPLTCLGDRLGSKASVPLACLGDRLGWQGQGARSCAFTSERSHGDSVETICLIAFAAVSLEEWGFTQHVLSKTA